MASLIFHPGSVPITENQIFLRAFAHQTLDDNFWVQIFEEIHHAIDVFLEGNHVKVTEDVLTRQTGAADDVKGNGA